MTVFMMRNGLQHRIPFLTNFGKALEGAFILNFLHTKRLLAP